MQALWFQAHIEGRPLPEMRTVGVREGFKWELRPGMRAQSRSWLTLRRFCHVEWILPTNTVLYPATPKPSC